MEDITFSIFNHGAKASSQLNILLKQFEQEEKIRVRLEMIAWSMGWQRLVETGLYHTGPDVSEIGSTWVMDFVRMNALRPFSQAEADEVTHGQTYFDASWAGGIASDHTIWAVPFGGDARVVFYRRDLLEAAGVEESRAFGSPTRLEKTLSLLEMTKNLTTLSIPIGRSRNNIHSLASWVWGFGGDFLSPDGNALQLDHPQTLDGFKAYFGLGRFLGKQRVTEEYASDGAFLLGKAATTISGYWILHEPKAPDVGDNLGVAPMPGAPFVGGEHLAVWKHTRRPEAALRLIHFLNKPESRALLHPHFGLPVLPGQWERAPFNQPDYDRFLDALQHGRSFSTSPLWGLVEKRLSDVMPDIWNEVLARPEKLDSIVENQIGSLSKRLQISMKA